MVFKQFDRRLSLQMADAGDLQGAVSMYIVLGQERVKGLMLESDTVLAWFYGYIDLLQSFRLYNIATCVSERSIFTDRLITQNRIAQNKNFCCPTRWKAIKWTGGGRNIKTVVHVQGVSPVVIFH